MSIISSSPRVTLRGNQSMVTLAHDLRVVPDFVRLDIISAAGTLAAPKFALVILSKDFATWAWLNAEGGAAEIVVQAKAVVLDESTNDLNKLPSPVLGGGSDNAPVSPNVYSVKAFGAVGDGTADDTRAIQLAINAAGVAGGGIVYLPRGTYRVQPQRSGQHCLYINYDNVELRGEGEGTTTIKCYVFGGATPDGTTPGTNFEVIAGAVHRGHGIFVSGTSDAAAPRKNFTLSNLRLTGQCARQTALYPYDESAPAFPASVVNGNGWDLTHKGVYIEENKQHDNHRFINCRIDSWRGEIIYYGGTGCKRVSIIDCEIHDSNGSAISMTAKMYMRGCKVYNASHGIENSPFNYENTIVENEFYTCGKGVVFPANIDGTFGETIVANNYFHECAVSGVWVTGFTQHVRIRGNTFRDCSYGTGSLADDCNVRILGQYGGVPCDITVEHNTFVADAISPAGCVYLDCSTSERIFITKNKATRTRAAATAGRSMVRSLRVAISASANPETVICADNYWECSQYPEVRNSSSATERNIPLYKGNEYVFGVIHQCLQIATGAVNAFVFSEDMQVYGNTADNYTQFPTLETANVKTGQRCTIIPQLSDDLVYFPQTGTGHKFSRPRFLGPNTRLVVEFDGTRWFDVEFTMKANAGPIRANDLLPNGQTVALWGTDIQAYGCDYVKLDPGGAVSYATHSNFPEGSLVAVEVNANVTIKNNAVIKLQAGADWVPGGTGGVIWFMKPQGSSIIYEIAKKAF